jgi:hypothetical protein
MYYSYYRYDSLECDTSKFTIVKKPILIAQLLQIVRGILVKDISIITRIKMQNNIRQ